MHDDPVGRSADRVAAYVSGEWLALVAVVTGGVGNSLTVQWHKADQLVPAKGYETPNR